MIKRIILSKNYLFWTIFHVLLGVASSLSPFGLIIWFYLVVGTSFLTIIRIKNVFPFIIFITYLTSFELLARMSQTSPFIPYELGKYLLCLMLIIGVFKFGFNSYLGLIMVVLILPSIFFDLSGKVDKQGLIFNLMGPINVGLAIWFFYGKSITKIQLIKLLRISLLPLISVLSSIIFKSPSYDELEFTLGASFATSGGGGSNQVSTLLGIGIFISFLFLINKWKITGNRILDFGLFFLFGFQGLLTFSRGGIIGGVLGILVILFFIMLSAESDKRRYKLPKLGKIFVLAAILLMITFQVADNLTGGLLGLRYLGETEGTLAGTKEKSIDSITTGRFNIFMEDLELWEENLVLGVGVGASSYLRGGSQFYLSHVELSRLLSEHGILGLLYFIILMYLMIRLIKSKKPPMEKGILVALFLIAIYTTFHAAMRTYLTPWFIGLSLMEIKYPKLGSKTSKKEVSKESNQPV
ncbi:MAG: O-antigen ligase family protein [Algoriphagus aquaeductus]|uniref:O-antigen ligase family protein n=1 Tax=Algoriphagus aquaeductus TaxID=475299 RepID=UPI00387996B5